MSEIGGTGLLKKNKEKKTNYMLLQETHFKYEDKD